MIKRDYYLEKIKDKMWNGSVKIITGMPISSGKRNATMCEAGGGPMTTAYRMWGY